MIYVELVDEDNNRHWHDIMSDEYDAPTTIEAARSLMACEIGLSDVEKGWKLNFFQIAEKPSYSCPPFGPAVVDTPELIRADQVQIGDLLDLQDDPYADPESGGGKELPMNSFDCELAEVTEVERETADCVRIGGSGFCVGFPVGHMLKRMGHDNRIEVEA